MKGRCLDAVSEHFSFGCQELGAEDLGRGASGGGKEGLRCPNVSVHVLKATRTSFPMLCILCECAEALQTSFPPSCSAVSSTLYFLLLLGMC
jgi:hypothetical protein